MGVHFPAPPPAAISRVLARFDRDQLAGFITVAIDLLDLADGDTDVEANGDELDCTGSAEEDTPMHAFGAGDGQPGDPDDAEDDDPREDDGEDRCLAGDDGCGAVATGHGQLAWGSEHEAGGILKPTYGEDQSLGPVN